MFDPASVRVRGPLRVHVEGFWADLMRQGYSPLSARNLLFVALETTQIYLDADLAMKERALARTAPPGTGSYRFRPRDSLLAFLEAL